MTHFFEFYKNDGIVRHFQFRKYIKLKGWQRFEPKFTGDGSVYVVKFWVGKLIMD